MKQFRFMFIVFAVISSTPHSWVYANTTYVSGHITNDTSWTKANSPYVVKGDVYVDSLVTLTIESGVEVRLDSMKHIMIYGTLNALGTEGDSILISALDTTKRWSRLFFKDASTGSLSYCRIEYAGESAIYEKHYNTGLLVIEHNTIINNHTEDKGGGIYSVGSSTINGNSITENFAERDGGGICSYDSSKITNNIITGNSADAGGGIEGGGSPIISGNVITGNSAIWGGGIHSYWGSPIITGNTITGNSAEDGGGIRNYGRPLAITGNIVTGNYAYYGAGISNHHGSSTISKNTITGNSAHYGGGIYDCGSSTIIENTIAENSASWGGSICGGCSYTGDSPTIKYNTITDTTVSAIYIWAESTLIDSNNIYATGYAVYNNDSFNIDARYNYWGTTDSATIANQKIWDYYDDSMKGIVYYEPFLTEPLDFGIEEKTGIRQKVIGIRVYPNPFTRRTAIKLLSYQATKKASIQIYDLSGRLISSYLINQNPITIGEALKSGIYFLKVQGYKPIKIVKLK